jgi:hypothetical protein
MKRQNKITHIIPLIFLFLFTAVSCEKAFEEALDRADDSRETLEGMLNDAGKVRGMFQACYAGVPKHRFYLYYLTSEESLTDNCFDAQGQSMDAWRSGAVSPTNPGVWAGELDNTYTNPQGAWWGRYWGAIRYCNLFLENIEKITVPLEQMPQNERDLMREEAIALRAFFHLKMISMYGPLPFVDKSFTIDYAGWADFKRPTYDEVAKRIAEELQGVIDRGIIPLKRESTNVNDKYRMPLGFVYGLKSRVLLYNASPLNNPTGDKAKYEAAAAAAKQFLDLNAYSLEPFANAKRMYITPYAVDVEAVEVIWRGREKVANVSGIAGMDLSTAVPKRSNYVQAKAGETPSQEIVDCYELKNGAMVILNYDATHASPKFTPEALAAGYDDVNNPYANRDARLSRDILYNGNVFGQSFQLGLITVMTYLGAPGTGTNGITTSGSNKKTYTGYYFSKDRDPLWYGNGTNVNANARCNHHSLYMRYAEIWLNYAEALCGAYRLDEACEALDKTRLRAGQPSIKAVPGAQTGNQQWLMKRIYNERRVELLLEDHRFYDVRRWDLISDVNNNTVSGILPERVGTTNNYTYKRYQIPFVWACHNEKYKILPIPAADQKLLQGLEQPEAWK